MKRSRGRSRKTGNQLNRQMDSNGPDVKIRGTAAHICEKYQSLARDAGSAGDRVMAENYLQHAEHYYRLVRAANGAAEKALVTRNEAEKLSDFDGDARGDGYEDATSIDADELSLETGPGDMGETQRQDNNEAGYAGGAQSSAAEGQGDAAKPARRKRSRKPAKTANGTGADSSPQNGSGNNGAGGNGGARQEASEGEAQSSETAAGSAPANADATHDASDKEILLS